MAQKLFCPVCHKLLIKNDDLVIDKPIVFDFRRIEQTDKPVKKIRCFNCKRDLKYFIDE